MKKKNFLKCICLNKNPQVRHLDYSSRYLRQVPSEIFNHERTLESLNLDNNNITELTKVRHLLREIPMEINETRSGTVLLQSSARTDSMR